ncbi:MAG: DUF4330 domain-containing protein [Clostridiaceae bacterium]|jgi:hypothetical protein|nr:DUF4330 domain-containing protein [Clostridiaceae bacterium]
MCECKIKQFFENLKQIKPVETIILCGVILALVVGFFTFTKFRQTASKQIEATSKITFQVFLRGVTLTGDINPIKKGEKTFISIRNVPYSDLDVVAVKTEKKKMVLPMMSSRKVMIADDVSQADMYDIIVTLTDTAKITKDGAVVGGNKVKIGLPITLEGQSYKLTGTVSALQIANNVNDNININGNSDVQ